MTKTCSFERSSLPHLVDAQLSTDADKILAREADGDDQVTWAQLHMRALAWAGMLASLGVEPGECVATMLPNSVASIVSWVGASYLGAVETPVNDAYKGPWLETVLDGARVRVAVVHDDYLASWLPSLAQYPLATIVILGGDQGRDELVGTTRLISIHNALSARSAYTQPRFAGPGEIASVLWTSGTTGRSKGVINPWGQWWDKMTRSNYFSDGELGRDDIGYRPWPVFHMSGREGVYRSGVTGGSVYLRRRFSAASWLTDIREGGCTWTSMPGGTADFVLSQPERPDDSENPLRVAIVAPVPQRIDELRQRFGLKRIYTSIGSTEVNNPISSRDYLVDGSNRSSCGRVNAGREVKLVDDNDRDVLGEGVGELCVRDDRAEHRITSGYLNNDEATRTATREGGWFRTGDVLRRDAAGYFYFVDRNKDMIRRRGENISSYEVELAVNMHPAVAEAAAFAVPADQGEDEVMVAIVPEAGEEIDLSELHAHLSAVMPTFVVPRYIDIVAALPRTPSSKIQKGPLRERGVSETTWDAVGQKAAPGTADWRKAGPVSLKPFEVTEEQQALRQAARRFLDKTSSLPRVREIVEGSPLHPRDWQALTQQMGLAAVAIPERWGGAGSSWLEQVVIFEEMGRALYAGPYFATVALATPALLLADDATAQKRFLPRIAAGELTGTLAFVEPDGDWSLGRCDTQAEDVAGAWRLRGTKSFVRDGVNADLLLVIAQTETGLSLFAVEDDAEDCARVRQETTDKTIEMATITFNETPATLVGGAGVARELLAKTLDFAALALSADQVGGAQRCLDMSVAYAKTRHQFGRPIGSFQAIKHMCVDMLTELEWARSTVHRAAWDAAQGTPEFSAHASLAKAQCSSAYTNIAAATIQVHGGLGFTWEHDAHLFFKRAKSSEVFLGGPAYHRELYLQRAID